eukprot:CAMPEP_0203635290 /NCGR_PEP_ID=MMETSP0088-20131115/2100_1 /ASSEMBLY_ACC=CAM_ASM_001087 /TAXON_ID=426623 /ORGANISM="Chaetoceros affinis, Strain CCMP159" /LENGTH=306 /DNA_ID=CAMNT_0050489127 /DNA_START=49 /DNA_END=969 /DNA_ORIENTATION=+
MKEAFAHEDEGSAASSPASVRSVMENAKTHFPGIVTTHQLARSLDVILGEKGFDKKKTLLATSLCCDEVCRDMEDELRAVYGQNFSFGGIGGFPFGGTTAYGALCHHCPTDGGTCLIVYASHVGIDYDGVIGKVNRRGHCGSGYCCNTAMASLAYVRAVNEGREIHSPDPSDPIDAQQVFVDSALMKHSDRLLNATHPELELPHVMNDCQADLLKRIMDKCVKDIPKGMKVALLGGIQVNCGEGLPDYFLPRRFSLCNSKGEIVEDLLQALINEGNRDPVEVLRKKKLDRLMTEAKKGQNDVPIIP